MAVQVNEVYDKLFKDTVGPIRKGVHRISKLISHNNLEAILSLPSIIVTGSNGKGTTSHLIELILRSQGLKTGLLTSPHFLSPCERICINGCPMESNDFLEGFNKIYPLSKNHPLNPSFFEIISLIAFNYFLKENVDVLVAEVGLGGRFDSINVLNPDISALTSISWEHGQYFGESVFDIAFDKSFVGRRNKSLYIPSLSKAARTGIEKAKEIIGFNLITTSHKVIDMTSLLEDKTDTLAKDFYSENLKMAYLIAGEFLTKRRKELDVKPIRHALREFKLPGRLDKRHIEGKNVIFDVAHNEESLSFLDKRLSEQKELEGAYSLVLAFLKDKEFCLQSKAFFNHCQALYFIEFDHPRSLTLRDYKRLNLSRFDNKRQIHYKKLRELDMSKLKGKIIFTGSFAFIAALFKKYKINVFEKKVT